MTHSTSIFTYFRLCSRVKFCGMKISTVYLSVLTFLLTSIVVGNAFYKKKQFYPLVVYVTKSNTSMAVIYVQFFVMVFIFGKLLRKIFLGTLRSTEFEHLLERFWYALTETCLAFTVFRDDFNPRFVALFTVLLFLKSFHWLSEERVDFMERSPVLGWLFHVRVLSLLVVLGFMDYHLLLHAYNSTIVRGPTVQLVFGFEYGILLTVIANTGIKYLLHSVEMQTENQWENKAVYLLYTELIIGLIKVLLYILFVIIMAKIYALPMFVFRPMFFTIRSFKKALSDVIMSRRAIRNMNTLYPDATAEELSQSDNICIICREDMVGNSKKLPCGHIFHTSCLRSWFQRQQTCPTCRLNILRNTNIVAHPVREENATLNDESSVGISNTILETETVPINFNKQTEATRLSLPTVALNNPIPFLAYQSTPPPRVPPNFDAMTEEELRTLEGIERHNIEERLKLLENIKTLLDATTILLSQYTLVTDHCFGTRDIASLNPRPSAQTSSNKNEALEDEIAASQEAKIDVNNTMSEKNKQENLDNSDNTLPNAQSTVLDELRQRRLKYLHDAA